MSESVWRVTPSMNNWSNWGYSVFKGSVRVYQSWYHWADRWEADAQGKRKMAEPQQVARQPVRESPPRWRMFVRLYLSEYIYIIRKNGEEVYRSWRLSSREAAGSFGRIQMDSMRKKEHTEWLARQ